MRKTWLLFSQAVTVAVALLFVVTTLKPEWVRRGGAAAPGIVSVNAPTSAAPVSMNAGAAVTSYSAAAKRASPAVVSITASKAPARNPRADDHRGVDPAIDPARRSLGRDGARCDPSRAATADAARDA